MTWPWGFFISDSLSEILGCTRNTIVVNTKIPAAQITAMAIPFQNPGPLCAFLKLHSNTDIGPDSAHIVIA
jgi:hypothetical protein